MSANATSTRLVELIPSMMAVWEERVRAEVPPAALAEGVILRDSLAAMLEVMSKVLSDRTNPRTAARDLAYITIHGKERADQTHYSLDELILECHILQEVVLETLEPDHQLDRRDRGIIIQYFNELVRVAAGEFVRVQKTLTDHADRLAKRDRSKDEFLAMLGHELRNPLASISTALFVLQEGPSNRAAQTAPLEIAVRQARHMKQLLDDLLDLARVNEGKIVLQSEPLELGAEVQQALNVAQGLFSLRKHVVSVSLPQEPIYVNADSVRFAQCIGNIFANAAKYTNLGGRIEVTLKREADGAAVRVRDNGVGIDPAVLPVVFELFGQAPRGPDRAGGGLGIGLTVVRRLIQLHGGRVDATSEGLGKGSEFLMWLPVLDSVPESGSVAPRLERTEPLKILLVEDNADTAQVMASALEMLGHHVVVAHDAPSAFAAVASDCPDIGLLDIGLPGMSGYELATKLRTGGFCHPLMKLVALSGYAEDKPALAAAGFDRHLIKPVRLGELGELLASVASAKGEVKRLAE